MNNIKAKPAAFSIRLLIAGILAFIGLYILSHNDYLLFHSIVELLGVGVAFSIFVIAWNARRFMSNDYLLFIGIGFLFVSIIETVHTLSYRGMGVFTGFEPTNLAAQFWIAARYLQSLTLLIAPIFIHRRLNTNVTFTIFGVGTALIIFSVLIWQIFPTTFIVGSGLTLFKVASEYIISGILIGAIFMLRRHRDEFPPNVVTFLIAAMAVNIASEMAFTLYSDAYGFFNAVGHFLMIVSIYFVYKAIIETGLSRPFDLMFHQLKLSEERFEERANELQRFELLSNNSRDIILMVGADDGRIVEANAAACAAYGYSRDELLSMNVRDLRTTDTLNLTTAQMAEANEKGVMFETVHRRRNGSEFPVEVSSRGATVAGTRLLLSVIRDITDRKKAEAALKQSEAKLKLKLEYILSPEAELIENDLEAIFDLPAVQSLMDDLHAVTGVAFAIIDLKGNVLVGTGWQEICTDFHRKSPKACANCIESDLALTRGVKQGEFKTYKCKNNMWDVVTPLYIADRHVGNVFTGQFFFDDEQPDMELFAHQAEEFGFDKTAYLDALKRAPRHSREKVAAIMEFFTRFAKMVSELGYSNLKLAKANADQKQAAEALKESQKQNEFLARLIRESSQALGIGYPDGRLGLVNHAFERLTGYTQEELQSLDWATVLTPPEWREMEQRKLIELHRTGQPTRYEKEYLRKDGTRVPIELLVHLITDSDGKPEFYYSFITDISARKKAEGALRDSEERLRLFIENAPAGIAMFDRDMRYIAVSRRWKDDYHLTGEIIGQSYYEIFPGVSETWKSAHRRGLAGETLGSPGEPFQRADSSTQWIKWEILPWHDTAGNIGGIMIAAEDISEQKKVEANQTLATGVLRILNRNDGLHQIINETVSFLRDSTGFDAVGLRLRQGEDCPYFEASGFSNEFLKEENFLCARKGDGTITRDKEGRPVLECTCGLVMSGRTDPTMDCFTPGGSFWTNQSTDLLSLPADADPRINPRNRCIHTGYQSVGLFPVTGGDKIIGLLQLNDHQPNRFTPEQLRFFEGIAQNIGLAIQRLASEAERSKLIEQIDDQRKLLESTLNQLPTGVAIRDTQGKLILGNNQLVTIFGEQPGLMNTFDISRCFHKDGRQYLPEEWPMNRTVENGESTFNEEFDIVRLDGSQATVLASTSPIRNDKGEVVVNVGVFRDISDRKQIEKEIESMARFPKENPNPVLRVDNKCLLIFANDAADYVLGCWEAKIGEKPPENICQIITDAVESGHDRTVDTLCGQRLFSLVFTPIREFGYVNIYGRDVTERKQAEEALHELNATLEHRVEQRTLELEAAYSDLSEQLKFRAQAEESLRSLSSRLLSIQEEERRAIARELHDQTGQSLTVLKLMIGRVDRMAPEEMKPILKDLGALTAEIIKQVRSLSLSLRPGILDDLGLVAAMEWLFKQLQTQADIQVHFERNAVTGLSADMSTVVYRICQEALTNIMRHAGVREAWVQLLSQDGKLLLKIEDHGRGFDTTAASLSTGLSAMRERAALLGGSYRIESSPGKGTIINVELPLSSPAT